MEHFLFFGSNLVSKYYLVCILLCSENDSQLRDEYSSRGGGGDTKIMNASQTGLQLKHLKTTYM